jgi:dihydroneopterin aldolase/2-amino-4-hydroxy-6-hydroxymethyldihydropteridine diphosphokinase
MDTLIIKNLQVSGFHGAESETDKTGETYIISAELKLNPNEAGVAHRRESRVDLAKICKEITEIFTHSKYKLIERSAEELAIHILLHYPMTNHVTMSLEKPWTTAGMKIDYTGITIEREWHTVYLGVGSNMGDRLKNINDAREMINETKTSRVTRASKIYETEPFGYRDQDKFLNCAFEVKTLLTPLTLIRFLLDIEHKLKRERKIHLGPRTIDLDVLFYDNIITSLEEAVIPHPRLHERRFVLTPLCDIAPYQFHPLLNKRCYRILEALQTDEPEPKEWSS